MHCILPTLPYRVQWRPHALSCILGYTAPISLTMFRILEEPHSCACTYPALHVYGAMPINTCVAVIQLSADDYILSASHARGTPFCKSGVLLQLNGDACNYASHA